MRAFIDSPALFLVPSSVFASLHGTCSLGRLPQSGSMITVLQSPCLVPWGALVARGDSAISNQQPSQIDHSRTGHQIYTYCNTGFLTTKLHPPLTRVNQSGSWSLKSRRSIGQQTQRPLTKPLTHWRCRVLTTYSLIYIERGSDKATPSIAIYTALEGKRVKVSDPRVVQHTINSCEGHANHKAPQRTKL